MADSTKLKGFKFDGPNSYLEVWVSGTCVAYFDDATADLTLLTNGLSVDSGGLTVTAGGITVTAGTVSVDDTTASSSTTTGSIHTDGGLGVVKDVVAGSTVKITDKITYSDQLIHAYDNSATISTDTTLGATSVGKMLTVAIDSLTITLPATVKGYVYNIMNLGADAANIVKVSPNSVDKIMGPDIAGADNKDIINTKATAKTGDMIQLIGEGSAGWYVTKVTGIWAAET